MRNILILGAGKSSIALIDYLVEKSAEENWQITVADISAEHARQKTKGRENTRAIAFDFYNEANRKQLIAESRLDEAIEAIVPYFTSKSFRFPPGNQYLR